jgi:hypothetical protein
MGDAADLALEGEAWDLTYSSESSPDMDTGEPAEGWPENWSNTRTKMCRYCGKTGLVWMKTSSGKWRLGKKGILHTCASYWGQESFNEGYK